MSTEIGASVLGGGVLSSELTKPNSETIKPETSNLKPETRIPKQITLENLTTAWNSFADTVKNDTCLFSILTTNIPLLKDETKIVYQISNVLQKEPLQVIESKLLQYLQTSLDNENLVIEIVLSENSESATKAYTAEEKFAQMSRKNPALMTFKQQFMLDFA